MATSRESAPSADRRPSVVWVSPVAMVGRATFAEPSGPPGACRRWRRRRSSTFHWTGGRGADLRLGHGLDRRVEGRAEHGDVQLVRVVEQRRRTARLDLDLPDARRRVGVRAHVGAAGVGRVVVVRVAVDRGASSTGRPYGWIAMNRVWLPVRQTAERDLKGLGALRDGHEVRLVAVALHRAGRREGVRRLASGAETTTVVRICLSMPSVRRVVELQDRAVHAGGLRRWPRP